MTRMLNGASDLAVVRLMVDMCAGLEIRLTAEGVERCTQVSVLRALGVRAIQGHHVARPMALDQLQSVLRRGLDQGCRDCFGGPGPVAAGRSGAGDAAGAQRAAVPSE